MQVRESLLLEVRLLRETLRDAQGDIERCRYFSSEMSRREAEISQRAEAKVQQCADLHARYVHNCSAEHDVLIILQIHAPERATGC